MKRLSGRGEKQARADEGFSVLEAIMAVAILSIALLPILNLQSQFVKTVESYERIQKRVTIERQILERIKAINFGANPQGSEPFGAYDLVWTVADADMASSTQSRTLRAANGRGGYNQRPKKRQEKRHEKQRGRYNYILQPVEVSLINDKAQSVYRTTLYPVGWVAKKGFVDTIF